MACGHSHAAILGYTLQQFEGYLQAADQRQREQLRLQAYAVAAGSAGGDELKKWSAALDKA